MRTWHEAELVVKREAALVMRHQGAAPRWPLVAVGSARPQAVITLCGVCPDRPSRTLAQLALTAAAFRPERVLVAVCVEQHRMVVAHELRTVADGQVTLVRAWPWRRWGRWVVWPPVEVRDWRVPDGLAMDVARAVMDERPACVQPALVHALVARCRAAGHRVRLAPGAEASPRAQSA